MVIVACACTRCDQTVVTSSPRNTIQTRQRPAEGPWAFGKVGSVSPRPLPVGDVPGWEIVVEGNHMVVLII
ncbi:hypothetical protein ACS5NO_29730 [Larkinella sp. GY13]|uniref:hypothetical protein n=1 Tax=Larkinella sp. GY13 TaxID=3453720 RepID=UPI003EE946E2